MLPDTADSFSNRAGTVLSKKDPADQQAGNSGKQMRRPPKAKQKGDERLCGFAPKNRTKPAVRAKIVVQKIGKHKNRNSDEKGTQRQNTALLFHGLSPPPLPLYCDTTIIAEKSTQTEGFRPQDKTFAFSLPRLTPAPHREPLFGRVHPTPQLSRHSGRSRARTPHIAPAVIFVVQ